MAKEKQQKTVNRKAEQAKAGKRARYTPPPKRNNDNQLARAAGEQQFFSPDIPSVLKETVTLASGDVMTKITPIFGVYDSHRKRWIRNSREADK